MNRNRSKSVYSHIWASGQILEPHPLNRRHTMAHCSWQICLWCLCGSKQDHLAPLYLSSDKRSEHKHLHCNLLPFLRIWRRFKPSHRAATLSISAIFRDKPVPGATWSNNRFWRRDTFATFLPVFVNQAHPRWQADNAFANKRHIMTHLFKLCEMHSYAQLSVTTYS